MLVNPSPNKTASINTTERPTLNLSLYFRNVQQPAVKLHSRLILTLHEEGWSAASFSCRNGPCYTVSKITLCLSLGPCRTDCIVTFILEHSKRINYIFRQKLQLRSGHNPGTKLIHLQN